MYIEYFLETLDNYWLICVNTKYNIKPISTYADTEVIYRFYSKTMCSENKLRISKNPGKAALTKLNVFRDSCSGNIKKLAVIMCCIMFGALKPIKDAYNLSVQIAFI